MIGILKENVMNVMNADIFAIENDFYTLEKVLSRGKKDRNKLPVSEK